MIGGAGKKISSALRIVCGLSPCKKSKWIARQRFTVCIVWSSLISCTEWCVKCVDVQTHSHIYLSSELWCSLAIHLFWADSPHAEASTNCVVMLQCSEWSSGNNGLLLHHHHQRAIPPKKENPFTHYGCKRKPCFLNSFVLWPLLVIQNVLSSLSLPFYLFILVSHQISEIRQHWSQRNKISQEVH